MAKVHHEEIKVTLSRISRNNENLTDVLTTEMMQAIEAIIGELFDDKVIVEVHKNEGEAFERD